MLKKFLPYVVLLFLVTGCKGKAAFNYSQNFVKKEQGLTPAIVETEVKVGDFVKTGKYDSIAAVSLKMEKKVDEQLQSITDEKVPDCKGGSEFKTACIKYFSYIKSMYRSYYNFAVAKSEDERNDNLSKVKDLVAEKTNQVAQIQLAQTQFASLNGFRIEGAKK